jgi:catalase
MAITAAPSTISPTASTSGIAERLSRAPYEDRRQRRLLDFREDDSDYFSQPRALFQLMTPAQQQVLFENTARGMGDAPDFIKARHIANCLRCDPAYGAGVAKALGLPVPSEVPTDPELAD